MPSDGQNGVDDDHDREAREEGRGRRVGVAVTVARGNHLSKDDRDHRPRGEARREREQLGEDGDEREAGDGRDRFWNPPESVV